MKKYVYPKFSNFDFGFVRLGGAGLGNLLFIFSYAVVCAKKNGADLIWPTWPSIKVGPWIRREKDKRFYGDLFKNDGTYIGGLRKVALLLFGKKHTIDNVDDEKANWDGVLLYSGFRMRFGDLVNDRNEIKSRLFSIARKEHLRSLEHDFTNEVNIHVRLGDFQKANVSQLNAGADNTSIPMEWYVKAVHDIKKVLGKEIKFNVFSDGTDDELEELLKIEGVFRMGYGSALADIIALAQSKVIIASGSSFSMWARFLGNGSCITFTNQLKEEICSDPFGFDFTYGLSDELSDDVVSKIRTMYNVSFDN